MSQSGRQGFLVSPSILGGEQAAPLQQEAMTTHPLALSAQTSAEQGTDDQDELCTSHTKSI